MIHKQDDAVGLLCPLLSMGGKLQNCVGPGCMMWLRAADVIETFAIHQSLQKPPDPPPGDGWVLGIQNNQIAWIRVIAKTGSCGLIKS